MQTDTICTADRTGGFSVEVTFAAGTGEDRIRVCAAFTADALVGLMPAGRAASVTNIGLDGIALVVFPFYDSLE